MGEISIKLIEMLPSILWFLFVVVLIAIFYRPIRNELIPKLGGLKAGGVELTFVIKESIDASIELADKSPQWKVEITRDDKEKVLNRAKQHLKVIKNAQMLWVDDRPENNLNERRMFRQLGVEIDIAKSNDEALRILKNARYDFIISDIDRGEGNPNGVDFLKQFRESNKTTPVIFYIGDFKPEKGAPPQSFGITDRPDELLHLVLDALERKKY